MNFPKENPRFPDSINNAHENPFVDFLLMAAGLLTLIVFMSFAIGWSASWLGPLIPYDWEPNISLGQHDTLSDDNLKIQDYLTELTERLSSDTETDYPVKVHWLPEIPDANAFATSGGHIHVTRGLLDSVSSENGLAMVLAHEYAHIEMRHPAMLMLKQLGHTILYMALGLGDSGAGSLAQNTGFVSLMSFSREMERAADNRALELLEKEYGHTNGASELFKSLLDKEMPSGIALERLQGWWQSHPATLERIENIEHKKKDGRFDQNLRPLPAWLSVALDTTKS
ncbi:MAG: M48 family metallopeptidase [Oleibacter sp.]|nr:M48 family metallopeptidase [Thalassolituus sp.]